MKEPPIPHVQHKGSEVILSADFIAWGLRYSAPLPGKEPVKKTTKGKK